MNGSSDLTQTNGAGSVMTNALVIPRSFKIQAVDGLTSAEPDVTFDLKRAQPPSTGEFQTFGLVDDIEGAPPAVPGDLNILAKLTGKFQGAGLNMIFRPAWGNIRRNNVLEYNLTKENTQFLEDIGDVPNRGLGMQRDVVVKAVPYTQMIDDMLNPDTGKADRAKPIAIHFESGMFLRTPPSEVRPIISRGYISRLASIPHGTTINCQGFEPDMKKPISGKPDIKPVSILPFPMGAPDDLETFAEFFPQLNFKKKFNLRIPQEIKEGDTLNPPLMLNPNQMLNELNENSTHKRIKEHIFFSIHSDSQVSQIPGGGTSNTGFLVGSGVHDGRQNPGPNADGVTVGCDYWISTVEYDVLLPEGDFSGNNKKDQDVESLARKEEREAGNKILISPTFKIHLNRNIPPNTIVKLEATQIQYSQNVTLNFDEMGWPHISVATLSPELPVPVPADKIIF